MVATCRWPNASYSAELMALLLTPSSAAWFLSTCT